MDLYWITVVFLVTRMVNALNLTSNSQQSEIANLKQEVNDLTTSVKNLTFALVSMQADFQRLNSRLDKKQTVAFSACLGSFGRTYGPHQPIEFDSVLLNEGSAYDPRHGIFRAPFGGFYHFAVNFLSAPPGSSYIEIVRDGNQLVYSYAAGDGYNLGSTQVNIRLEAGQDVWCRNAFTSGTISLNSNGKYSCFSGHIIS